MPRPRIPRNALVLAFVALLSGFGQDLITPILPGFLVLIGVGHAGIGFIDGLLQGSTSVFRFVSGLLSDRFHNRKRFVFLGYAASSVARPLLAMTGSFGSVALLRLLDGVGKGMKDAPRDALVADSAQAGGRGRAFGFHRFVDTSGSVLGPLAAAGLLFWLVPSLTSYRLIFLTAALPGSIALFLIWKCVREPEAVRAKQTPIRGRLPVAFWLFTLASSVAMLTKMNDSLFLTRVHDIGIAQNEIPLVFAGFTFIYAVISYPIGILSDRFGRLPFLCAGWGMLGLVELGFANTSSIGFALVLLGFYGVFFALTEGSGRALIADLVPAENRGTAYAIFYTATGLAVIIGGFGLGRVWDNASFTSAFTVSAIGSLIGAALFLRMWMHEK